MLETRRTDSFRYPKTGETSLFLEDTYFIPCAWQQWLSKLRAERCWVVFELVSRWCKCVWGSCSGDWMSHWWLCWYCSRVVTGGSGVRSWQKPSLTVTVWATLWDPGRPELLRSWFSLQSCVSEGTAPELQPFGVFKGFLFSCWHYPGSSSSGGLWSPGLLLDFEQQTCPAATCQENHLWSHLQTVDDLEVSAVEGWGQAWSGVPLQAGKWDLSRPAEGWFTVRCGASLNSSTLLKCPCCHSRTHCSSNSGLLSFLTPEIFIFWRNIFCLADILKLQNSFRSCRFPNSLEKLSAFPDLLLVSRREKGSVWGWEERGDTSCFFGACEHSDFWECFAMALFNAKETS